MAYLYAINVKNMVDAIENKDYLDIVSNGRKQRADKFYFEIDKVRSIYSEMVLRYALWDLYQVNQIHLRFDENKYGKPYLVDYADIYFNISHSGEWVLCGISNHEIGVDVEQIKKVDLSWIERTLPVDECEYIQQFEDEERLNAFYKVWTLKESYVKMLGMGLQIPLNSFHFQFNIESMKLYHLGEEKTGLFFYSNTIDQNHFIAICGEKGGEKCCESMIRYVKKEDLKKWYRCLMQAGYENFVTVQK